MDMSKKAQEALAIIDKINEELAVDAKTSAKSDKNGHKQQIPVSIYANIHMVYWRTHRYKNQKKKVEIVKKKGEATASTTGEAPKRPPPPPVIKIPIMSASTQTLGALKRNHSRNASCDARIEIRKTVASQTDITGLYLEKMIKNGSENPFLEEIRQLRQTQSHQGEDIKEILKLRNGEPSEYMASVTNALNSLKEEFDSKTDDLRTELNAKLDHIIRGVSKSTGRKDNGDEMRRYMAGIKDLERSNTSLNERIEQESNMRKRLETEMREIARAGAEKETIINEIQREWARNSNSVGADVQSLKNMVTELVLTTSRLGYFNTPPQAQTDESKRRSSKKSTSKRSKKDMLANPTYPSLDIEEGAKKEGKETKEHKSNTADLYVEVIEANGLPSSEKDNGMLYCRVDTTDKGKHAAKTTTLFVTRGVEVTGNPHWKEMRMATVDFSQLVDITFWIYFQKKFSLKSTGICYATVVPYEALSGADLESKEKTEFDSWLPLYQEDGGSSIPDAKIHVRIQFNFNFKRGKQPKA